MAHQDVVPVEGQKWDHDPFGAEIIDGEIWARGSLDTKDIAAGFFEAAAYLIDTGYVPPRDVWYFSSSGEEISSAVVYDAVDWLREHDVHPYLVLDEGGAVATEVGLGVDAPIALIGVTEKGYADVTVRTISPGGHASNPSPNDATVLLSRICARVGNHPPKAKISAVVEAMLTELAAHGSPFYKKVFGNINLTRPLIAKILADNHETAGMVRTTYALTQLEGSPSHNVLPTTAVANYNVRVLPSETLANAVDRIQKVADHEARKSGVASGVIVEVNESIPHSEPSPVSPYINDPAFDYIHRCVAGVYPEAGCAPYEVTACTDAHAFCAICDRVYRFGGFIYSKEARSLIHGPNERIGVDVFKRDMAFYVAFLANLEKVDHLGA